MNGTATEPAPKTGRTLLRKIAAVAPAAAGYTVFQAMLSSIPASLSGDTLRFMFAAVSGIAAAFITAYTTLRIKRNGNNGDGDKALGPGGIQTSPPDINILTISERCYAATARAVQRYDDPDLGRLAGWTHFLNEKARPTAIGTAYGLKLALALGSSDGRVDRAELVDTLWSLRRPDGGWAARTQGMVGRPEVTALVLGALASAGSDAQALNDAISTFERSLAQDDDAVFTERTYLVSTVIGGLLRARPSSPQIRRLGLMLQSGTIQDPQHGDMLCWGDRFPSPTQPPPVPSVVHTARAIVALQRWARVGGEGAATRATITQAVDWLVGVGTLEDKTEHIRRPTGNTSESLTVHHFTAAWVARALMGTPAPRTPEAARLLAAAVDAVGKHQTDGIWAAADDGSTPLWMTYQGITVLRDHALLLEAAP